MKPSSLLLNPERMNVNLSLSRLRTSLAGALIGLLLLDLTPCGAAQADRAREKKGDSGLSEFKIIAERNIFNPKRYARSASSKPRESSRAARADSLALTGTMDYEKGRFAFFEGSHSSYKKVVEQEGKVADLQVVRIEPHGVLLTSGTNEFILKVGHQLRRQEGGSWKMAGAADLASSSRSYAPPPPPQPQQTQPQEPEQSGPMELISQYLENALGAGPPPMPPPMPGNGFSPPEPPAGSPTQPQPLAAPPDLNGAPQSDTAVQAAPSAPAQSTDEILRRLMERREQE